MSTPMNEVTAQLTDEQLDTLKTLAAQRGLSANTVLQQAIATEGLLAANVGKNDVLQIKKPDNTVSEVVFDSD